MTKMAATHSALSSPERPTVPALYLLALVPVTVTVTGQTRCPQHDCSFYPKHSGELSLVERPPTPTSSPAPVSSGPRYFPIPTFFTPK
jgi:hypothetical protein